MNLERFVTNFNREFTSFGLNDSHVKSFITLDGYLCISLGQKNVVFDSDGSVREVGNFDNRELDEVSIYCQPTISAEHINVNFVIGEPEVLADASIEVEPRPTTVKDDTQTTKDVFNASVCRYMENHNVSFEEATRVLQSNASFDVV